MANLFKIEVRVSGGSWEDVTAYINADSWGGSDVIAEDGLLNYTAGSMSFQLTDRDAGKAAHYWVERLAASTTDAEVRVTQLLPASKTIFFGYVEPGLFSYESDVITAFTATSILAHANKIDAAPALNGEAALTRYSGGAFTLLTSLLRKLGCLAGTSPDVVVKDLPLGAEGVQAAVDWNHEKRYWSDPNIDLDADTTSDVATTVPNTGVPTGMYVCKQGRLYGFSANGELTEQLDAGSAPFTITGHRLLRYIGLEAGNPVECLAVVEAETRHSYTHQGRQQSWGTWANLGFGFGAAALVAFGIVTGGWTLALGAGAMAAGMGINALAQTWRDIANGDKFYAVTGVRLLTVGSTGLGRSGLAWDNTVVPLPPPAQNGSRYVYVPGDAVCVQNIAAAFGRILWTVWNVGAVKATPYRSTYSGGVWVPEGIMSMGSTECGKPVSMAVANGCIYVGATNGCVIAAPVWNNVSKTVIVYASQFMALKQAAGRFVGAIFRDQGNGSLFIYFVPGNGTSTLETGELRGAAIRQQYQTSSDYYVNGSLPAPELAPIGLGESLDGFLVVSCHYQRVGIGGVWYLPCIYEAADEDNRRLLYPGMIYTTSAGIYCQTTQGASIAPCVYPMSNSAGDWRPPTAWYDNATGQKVYRLLTVCSWTDRDTLITDVHQTSLYAKLMIHHDFDRDPVSIGSVISEAARSGWLYVRLMILDACNSADAVRIISRHAWTPPSAGDLDKDYVAASPRVDGIEFYDGAVADIGGQRIEAGSVGVGKTVYQLSGAYLTPALARAMGLRVVAEYPRTSADYPLGRRRFVPDVVRLDDGGNELPPGHADLFKRAGVTFLTGLNTSAIITSIGLDRASLQYPCRLLEYKVSAGAGAGVDWTTNQPTASPVAPTYPDLDAAITFTNVAPTISLYAWSGPRNLSATPQDNPKDGACAWAFRVKLPPGVILAGYAFKMTTTTGVNTAVFHVDVWSDSDNRPSVPIAGTRTDSNYTGVGAAGLFFLPLLDDGGSPDATRRTPLPTDVWVVVSINRDDATPTTSPPLVWGDTLVVMHDQAYNLSYADVGETWPAWLTAWSPANELVTRYAPEVMIVGVS